MDGPFRFRLSADALRQTVARLRRQPRTWIGVLAVGACFLIACQVGLVPVSLTRAETGHVVAADWADVGREPIYHPRITPDVAPEPPVTEDTPTPPLAALPQEPSPAPVTPVHPVLPTGPMVEQPGIEPPTIVAMADQPRSLAPAPMPVPTSAPPFVEASLASSAVWPRLRGDGPVRAVAVVFLGVDCPASAAVLPRLSRVHATWGELGVRLVGIVVGPGVTPTEAAQFRAAHRLRFPVMTDRSGALQQLLSPTHTPEVFVLNPRGVVAYSGRIDDDALPPEQLGRAVPRVHVEDALAAVVAGRRPVVPRTAPTGRPLISGAAGSPDPSVPASVLYRAAPAAGAALQ
jgi:hypothetical protein